MRDRLVKYTLEGVTDIGFILTFGEWTSPSKGHIILSHGIMSGREMQRLQSYARIPVYEYTQKNWYGIFPYNASYLWCYYKDSGKYNPKTFGYKIISYLHQVDDKTWEGVIRRNV